VTLPSAIERKDQQYKRYVEVDYVGPHPLGDKFLETSLASFSVPPGFRIERSQRLYITNDEQRSWLWMTVGTVALVFLITAMVFESWRLPFLVLLSAPTALVGVALAFLWTESNFGHGAFIGMVLLVGIAANDSILLVHRYQELREGSPWRDRRILIRLAVRERLRPMWTTSLTTCAAMLPLIVSPEDGEFWHGLALTVTGGLVSSTLLAPLLTVALTCWRNNDVPSTPKS
jgi:multidrug efflux pump subunit AcrB